MVDPLPFLNVHADQTLTKFTIIPDFVFCFKKIYTNVTKVVKSESYVHCEQICIPVNRNLKKSHSKLRHRLNVRD